MHTLGTSELVHVRVQKTDPEIYFCFVEIKSTSKYNIKIGLKIAKLGVFECAKLRVIYLWSNFQIQDNNALSIIFYGQVFHTRTRPNPNVL